MARSKGCTKIEAVKRGRFRGTIYKTASGKTVFLATRRQQDMIRDGWQTCSDAVRAGVAGWGLDDAIAYDLRAKGVEYAGVLVRGSSDKYVAPLSAWFDSKLALVSYNPRYANQRCLPLTAFRYRLGRTRI